MEIKYIKIWNALTNIDEKNKIKQYIHEKMWEYYTKWLEISEHKCIIKLQRTFVLIYTTERRVQSNIAQKNMQDMLQLKILGHDENLSKIARKKYVRTANLKMPSGTANLKMPSGKVEIGLDESKSCLYGVVLDQATKRIGIQHLGDIKTLLDEENK